MRVTAAGVDLGIVFAAALRLDGVATAVAVVVLGLSLGFVAGCLVKRRLGP